VYRDLPLTSIHQYAQKAAEASECADDQGKFWEYHDLLFANQSAIDVDSLKAYAVRLGLDTASFNNCLDSGKQTSEVQKDAQDAQSYGAGGTPAFFINGRFVSGAIPFDDYQDSSGATQPGFKSIIDAALEEVEQSDATATGLDSGPPPVDAEPRFTATGLGIIDIEVGTGETPAVGQTLVVHYTGWLSADGSKFDSSVDRGTPIEFVLGVGQVIAGWDEGLSTMKVGGERRLIIPADLAYGEVGRPPTIPPNAELIFDVELLEIR
jgi:peptidylprolyl isomerase